MASIASTVRDFKRDPESFLPDELIHQALDATQHRWRDRLLGPVVTVRLMILQVLMGNVSGRALLRLANLAASDTAYFAARARLPVDVLDRKGDKYIYQVRLEHRARKMYLSPFSGVPTSGGGGA